MPRRTVLLIASLGAAFLGVLLVIVYVNGVDSRARKGQEIVEVLYTKVPIQLGTSGATAEQGGAFELRKVARDAAAAGALSSVGPIQGLTALIAIPAGQPVTSSQWGESNATSSLAIPGTKVAISIQLGDTQRVAGFVTPGSDVAIFITRNNATNVLIPRVRVLAVGSSTINGSAGNSEPVASSIFTLALDQNDAEKVILGQGNGALSFALLSKDSRTGRNGRTTTSDLR